MHYTLKKCHISINLKKTIFFCFKSHVQYVNASFLKLEDFNLTFFQLNNPLKSLKLSRLSCFIRINPKQAKILGSGSKKTVRGILETRTLALRKITVTKIFVCYQFYMQSVIQVVNYDLKSSSQSLNLFCKLKLCICQTVLMRE